MATARKRRASQSAKKDRMTAAASKQVLKALITLDPYEEELADNVQNEGIWNESSSSNASANNNSTRSKVSTATSASFASTVDSDEKSQELPGQIAEELAAFEAAERERDAKLPEEYRKFRPKGFDFKLPPKGRPVRVYADGVFDLFHMGHMKQLEQAKKSLPNVTMVVGVPNDKLVHKLKGLTVLSDEQRYETLRHCKWVDEVIPDAPWQVAADFLKEHQIDYVAHDDAPYAGPNGQEDIYKFVKEQGQFMTTQRTDGISTSDIITRIVKDYDLYLMRNFKRGVSRKELNVSWIKKNELDIKRHVNAFRDSWRNNVETTTRDIYADLLSYAIRAPPNSVLGRARDWMTRHIESSNGSPHHSPSEGSPTVTPDDSAENSPENSPAGSRWAAPDEEEPGTPTKSRLDDPRSPKRRRVSSN